MIFAETIFHEDGTIEHIDNRTVEACRNAAIIRLKGGCQKAILENAPDYKQRNAALGLLDSEETNTIIQCVQQNRQRYEQLKQQVNSIIWDGTESNRIVCCDELNNINW
jgi:hypothetical protein